MTLDLDAVAESANFSGVVRFIPGPTAEPVELARGYADRNRQIANQLSTRFGSASATKGLTAVTVVALIESGVLAFDTPVHSILGSELPHIDAGVTIAHLLEHRSGVGDYLNEEELGDIDDYALEVSMHTLTSPMAYLALMNANGQVSSPGERFVYNNSGYVLLSMVIEKLTTSFHDAVVTRVLRRCGMNRSGFFRSDDLPADTALGYLEDGRTNIFHLPVIGAGDGGIYLCANDVSRFWAGLMNGDIVSRERVKHLTSVVSEGHRDRSYGRGFWLTPDGSVAWLEGMDAGVSFKSAYHLDSGAHYVVLSNTSRGAWPLARHLGEQL